MEQVGRCQPVREGLECLEDILSAAGCKNQEMDPGSEHQEDDRSPDQDPDKHYYREEGAKVAGTTLGKNMDSRSATMAVIIASKSRSGMKYARTVRISSARDCRKVSTGLAMNPFVFAISESNIGET